MKCPKCQSEYPDNYGFCLKDGEMLTAVPNAVNTSASSTLSVAGLSGKTLMGIGALLVIITLTALLIVTSRKGATQTDEAKEPSPALNAPPSAPPNFVPPKPTYERCALWNDVAGFSRVNVRRDCGSGDCREAGRYNDNTQVEATGERVERYVKGHPFTFRKIFIEGEEFWVAEKKLRCN
jgi:hypothetical protein